MSNLSDDTLRKVRPPLILVSLADAVQILEQIQTQVRLTLLTTLIWWTPARAGLVPSGTKELMTQAVTSQRALAVVKTQIQSKERERKILQLTMRELATVPQESRLYTGVGKM